jgi:hypothetical protein
VVEENKRLKECRARNADTAGLGTTAALPR